MSAVRLGRRAKVLGFPDSMTLSAPPRAFPARARPSRAHSTARLGPLLLPRLRPVRNAASPAASEPPATPLCFARAGSPPLTVREALLAVIFFFFFLFFFCKCRDATGGALRWVRDN